MFNILRNNRYNSLKVNDAYAEYEEEHDTHENLDDDVHRIVESLKRRAAFESCISSIEVEEDYTLFNGICNKVQGIARKRWFKEAAIIAAILLFKTGLFMSYREAHKVNLEIPDL
ncbi:hypothetical protein [Desulfosporosinus youngiae]|uniref:Uncharacterized protein n=1 Tax=Desulfosporosinus youngiae DSM 17734 TaxID=768710 RepID=H5Y0T0_9FIRM|nr:hypothetical protein [Desulfosporosinus youngiae]EHQ92336.1 hypothetical protein DesyoDRAFT_5412 [Desulfosporosinus youngiae DSM 17734]